MRERFNNEGVWMERARALAESMGASVVHHSPAIGHDGHDSQRRRRMGYRRWVMQVGALSKPDGFCGAASDGT
jgi:hypothetical protein